MLRVSNLTKFFGGLRALSNLDFSVEPGEIVGLIGPNGSGKTTTINVLTGVYSLSAGAVFLGDRDITGKKSEAIVRAGIARTFQNVRLFSNRSVLDNIRAAQTIHCRSALSRIAAYPTVEEKELRREANELVERFSLEGKVDRPAGALSYGEKKRLEIARALALRPRILLLDEPAAGMNPVELDRLIGIIRDIGRSGIGVVLVEHHMKLVMNVCDKVVVLNFGQKIAEGTPAVVARDEAVIEAYLGKAH